MTFSTSISCMKNGRARSAITNFWRWQSGGAAAKEERREGLASKESEFESSDYLVSEASQIPSSPNYWKSHKNPYVAPKATNASTGDRLAEPAASSYSDRAIGIHRDWQHASHSTLKPPQESFVVISFNVLASTHAHNHRSLYPSVPNHALAWTRRKKKILEKLDSCSPDILCLQEVDQFKDLEANLVWRGYTGLYKARTGEMPDGCAIFWRKERFQLLQERSFEFSMLGMRHNVAQLCVLQLIVPGLTDSKNCSSVFRSEGQTQTYRLVVGNIHVLFNPKRGEIKLGQCRAFLEQVNFMSNIWHGAPVVIGGDFNSTPSSAVYKYLATSELELSNLDRRCLSGLIPEVPSPDLNKSRKEEPHWERLKGSSTELTIASQKVATFTETISMECVGVINQTNSCPSLDSNFGDRNGHRKEPEQILGSREQISDHTDSMAAVLKGATENPDASIEYRIECTELMPPNHGKTCSDSSSSSTEGHCEYSSGKYGLDLEELRIATGKPDCTLMQHELNLYSAYSDIQGHTGTRDAKGEPLVTACHKNFLGTVDYIWRNDGLKTMRVLETVPVKALKKNRGLPIMMWGSDHLPLVCELAFT